MYNIAVSMLVGLVLGVTLAFVMESMDTSIKSAEDVERVIAAPALAVIPLARSSWLRMGGDKSQPQSGAVESIVLRQPTSYLAESYRILRTSILLSTAPRPPQTLLVTSAPPGEGKTCTSLNLAMGLAQRGVPVVLVDADMRRPGIPRALALAENGAGLSTLLSGAHSLDEVLRQYEPVPNLWVLPAGPTASQPGGLALFTHHGKSLRGVARALRACGVGLRPFAAGDGRHDSLQARRRSGAGGGKRSHGTPRPDARSKDSRKRRGKNSGHGPE